MIRIVKFSMTFIFVFLSITASIAQDKIVTVNDKIIKCRVTKVGAEYVEYLDRAEAYGSIEKSKVRHIEFNKEPRDPIDFSDNTTTAIKFNLLALTKNALHFSYEKATDAVTSFEIGFKVYGVTIRDFETRKIGGGIDIGYRFRIGDIIDDTQRRRHRHVLDGIGIKPTIGGSFAEKDNEGTIEKYYYVHAGAILNYQVAFRNRIIMEAYGGLHVFKGKSTIQFPNTPLLNGVLDFEDGDLYGSDNVAFSYGLKFGYLFGGFGRSEKLLRW